MLSLQKCHLSKFQFSILSLKKRVFIAMLRNKIITVFIFFAGLFFLSCNPAEPDNKPADFEFAAEDASCTEAWLTLKVNDIAGAKVYRGDSLIFNLTQQSIDTTLYDEGLLPNNVYKYHTTIQLYNNSNAVTKELTIQTMDTTSHNFSWQTWSFGKHSSSVLYDVAIINENNIWAVGEIYMKDSLGNPDQHAYNAVHWDGSSWELKRIPYDYHGTNFYHPIKAVFAFGQDNIWFCGNGVIHWDGNSFVPIPIPENVWGPYQMNKIWGTSSSDLYVVGNGGNIAHYDGSPLANGWTKIESGTELTIGDIWGVKDSNGGFIKFLAAGEKMFIINQKNEVLKVNKEPYMFINSTWGINDRIIYTAGNGIVLYKNNKWKKLAESETNTIYFVKGDNYNNIMGLSSNFNIIHFNGYSWEFLKAGSINIYYRLEVKNNLAIAVGWQDDKAVVTVIKRNN